MKKRIISFMLSLFMVLTLLAPATNVSAETTAEFTQVEVVSPIANSYYNSGNDGGPEFAFNDNSTNWWHTNYGNAGTGNKNVNSFTNEQVSEIPEFYKISDGRVWIGGKFNETVNLGKFKYHARTDRQNNYIEQWALYTANVTTGEPTDADFALAANGTFGAQCSGSGADAEVVLENPVKATHFRLVAFSFIGGQVTASKIAMYSAAKTDENGAKLVYLREGESYTCTMNGSIEIDNPTLNGLNTDIATGEVIPGEASKYPYSVAKLATAQANYNGEEKELEECLFTFTPVEGAANTFIISNTNGDSTIYFASGMSSDAKKPCVSSGTNLQVIVGTDNNRFTFNNKYTKNGSEVNGYLFFHIDTSSLHFNRNSTTSGDNTRFDLFTPMADAPEDSSIPGYKKLTDVTDIVSGGQYLIAAKGNDNQYYILNPVVGGQIYDYAAKVVTYEAPKVPGVQLASSVGNFDVAGLKKATDCLFTFTKAEGDNKYIISAETEDGTRVDVNVKSDAPKKPTRAATNNVITLAQKSESEPTLFSLHDASGAYLYFHRDSNYHFNRNSSMNATYCYFELYKPSENADSAIPGFAQITSLTEITDGGQYLIAATSTATPTSYYFMYPSVGSNECQYVAKLTDTMIEVDTPADTRIIFTGVEEGETSVTISGVTYRIIVANDARTITLRKGESICVSGTLQSELDPQSAVRIEGTASDKSEVTAIAEGTAEFVLNGINYTIHVLPADVAGLQEDIANAEDTYAAADYLAREWALYQATLAEVKECAAAGATMTQPEVEAARTKLANAIAALIRKPVYDDTVTAEKELADGAPTGTTQDQPFADGTAGSNNFRIPALITLSDGTIIAASDARWNWSRDAKSIDIIMSKSKDGGKTWEYTLPIFFNDSTNQAADYGACFIDPLMVRDKNDKIYLLVDLYPGGIAINSAPKTPDAASGFIEIDGEKRLVLYTTDNPDNQDDTNYSYYVGDYVKDEEQELAPVYEVLGEGNYSDTASFYMDRYFYLYTADKMPMYCEQIGDTTKKVQQNVFFHNSLLHVRAATYLYLVTSEDKGETWSAPRLLNEQVRKESNLDVFYGVGPGAGLWIDNGTEHGIVMMPAYTYSNQIASFVYSTDGGVTWKRSQNSTSSSWSSESCLVQIDDTTVRHFFRSGTSTLQYTDHTFVDGEWVAGSVVTMNDVARKNNNQVSAIRYSKTIDGKPVIIFSTATVGGLYERKNGKIYVFTVDMDAAGKPMTLVATYDNDPTTETDVYAYSSIAELEDGSIGLLYEYDDTANACKITYKTIPMNELAPGVKFDIPASADGVRTEVAGYNLVLEGNIGVNFHMLLGEEVTEDAGAKMIFTLERENGTDTVIVPVTEDLAIVEDGVKYYVFKCPVPVKDMDTEIKAQIILSDGRKGSEHTYTVKKYIDYMLENDDTYAKEIELVTKMSDFGDYAATYFADEKVDSIPEVTTEELEELVEYQATLPEDEDTFYYGSSLLLKSDTILRHYFTKEVTVEGYEVVKKGNLYYIETEGILAHELGEKITVTAVADGKEIMLSYSPLSYAYIALSRENADNLTNLMRAMYDYYQAAQAYRNPTTDN